jgi:hypothetical protein
VKRKTTTQEFKEIDEVKGEKDRRKMPIVIYYASCVVLPIITVIDHRHPPISFIKHIQPANQPTKHPIHPAS